MWHLLGKMLLYTSAFLLEEFPRPAVPPSAWSQGALCCSCVRVLRQVLCFSGVYLSGVGQESQPAKEWRHPSSVFRSGLEEMTTEGTSLALSSIITPNIPCSLVRPSLLPPFNEPYVFTRFYFVFTTNSFSPPCSKRLKNFPRDSFVYLTSSPSLIPLFSISFLYFGTQKHRKKSELWRQELWLGS